MQLNCHHCEANHPVDKLNVCHDCSISACGSCLIEHHSSVEEGDGTLVLHKFSKWHERFHATTTTREFDQGSDTSFGMQPHVPGSFGLLLDIDGVILQGKNILPNVKEAFGLLTDSSGRFRVPTVFVTNAGHISSEDYAVWLSEKLEVEISAVQVLTSHCPLRMFTEFHDKHVLVCGQGPITEIAQGLGFAKVSTMEDIRHAYPNLDMVDRSLRNLTPSGLEDSFPRVEAIVLFGLPARWECQLQLLADLLMTNGKPTKANVNQAASPYPHIPILACNVDMLWMSEAPLPRFGHGSFLLCLETLYKKLTGFDLKYTVQSGKPHDVTYQHAENCLREVAVKSQLPLPRNVYAIGDNPDTDILGANMFQQYLYKRTSVSSSVVRLPSTGVVSGDPGSSGSVRFEHQETSAVISCIDRCFSVLVSTGVYTEPNSCPTDIVDVKETKYDKAKTLKTPSFSVPDLLAAVKMIFEREEFS